MVGLGPEGSSSDALFGDLIERVSKPATVPVFMGSCNEWPVELLLRCISSAFDWSFQEFPWGAASEVCDHVLGNG